MAGYAVVAKLSSAAIQAAGTGRSTPAELARWSSARDDDGPFEDLRVVRSWSAGKTGPRFTGIRRVWSQTTFYLFDAEGWR
jgi:hypothetical protein